jgi:hypothetical protein
MNLTDLHRRLLRDVLDIGVAHGFVITGGYAVQAHGLVNRLSRDLDVATQSPAQMEAIAAALADRGAARDLIDVRAASNLYSTADLENLGRRHARDEFRLEDLATRLDGAEWFDDEAFTAYGLTEDEVSDLRAWAREWSDDIADRISEQVIEDDLP